MVPSLAQQDRGISRALPIAWPKTQAATVAEIERRGTTIDYTKLCDDKQVVFFGQKVSNKPVRDHLCHNAAALKQAGVTHFAIEFDKMPPSPDYKRLCDELSAHGIEIILADVDQSRTPDEEQREAYMTKRIVDIFKVEPNAKVAALFSSFHTGRCFMDGIRPVADRIESAGYSLIRLMYCGGSDPIPTLITHACRGKTSIALDMRPYGADAPFGADADFMLYLG